MDPLAQMIQDKISSGVLPREVDFATTWYGRGTGRRCVACERPIPVFDIEVEGDLDDGGVLYFHGGCYRTWDTERRRS